MKPKAFLVSALVLTAFALAACGSDSSSSTSSETEAEPTATTAPAEAPAAPAEGEKLERSVKVEIANFDYSPDPVRVEAGGKVIWQNKDSVAAHRDRRRRQLRHRHDRGRQAQVGDLQAAGHLHLPLRNPPADARHDRSRRKGIARRRGRYGGLRRPARVDHGVRHLVAAPVAGDGADELVALERQQAWSASWSAPSPCAARRAAGRSRRTIRRGPRCAGRRRLRRPRPRPPRSGRSGRRGRPG